MDQNTKQRLVGIVVVFALAVIFLPMILDGSGIRKNDLQVVIPPQPVVASNPDFDNKIIELHAEVDELPVLQSRFVDELSSESGNVIEREKNPVKSTGESAQINKTAVETAPVKVGGDTWVIQVGSFKDRAKAIKERDRLRKSNIAAVFIEKFNIDDTTSYRVRLGPFPNRDLSRIAQNKVKAKHNIDSLIMRYEK